MLWYISLAALITLSIAVFAIQNSQQVTLKFLHWDLPSFPLVLLILFSAATGMLVTLLFSVTKQLRMTIQVKDLQARIKKLEKQLSAQPTKDSTEHCPASDSQQPESVKSDKL